MASTTFDVIQNEDCSQPLKYAIQQHSKCASPKVIGGGAKMGTLEHINGYGTDS